MLENSHDLQNLIKYNNVVLSPHIAGWSHESYLKFLKYYIKKFLVISFLIINLNLILAVNYFVFFVQSKIFLSIINLSSLLKV